MTNPTDRSMAKATELSRSGKLQEATAMIRSLLQRPAKTAEPADPKPADPDPAAAGETIEGSFARVDPPTAEPSPPASARSPAAKLRTPRPGAAKSPRTTLAETLRKIAAGGMPVRGPLGAAPPPVATGAQFLALDHTSAQGSRSYRIYIPANRPDGLMPLVVMLHGCTQTPEDFATGTGMNLLAEDHGCMIAYPAQPSGANVQKCWNWFRPEDQGRDRGEPALIAGLTRDILQTYPADPGRTYVAGLSAGGAAAVLVAAAYPDIFSAVGVHSGLPGGGAHDIASAFAAMRSGTYSVPHRTAVPTIVFHGLSDSTVHPGNGDAVVAQALHAMPDLRRVTQHGTSHGGRTYRMTGHHHPDGRTFAEHWEIDGAGHAWAGGHANGSYTDPQGPDASHQMLRFFLQHSRR